MKNILSIAICLLIINVSYCQDTIKTVSGSKIIAKVIEIERDDVQYKRYTNIEGPSYVLDKNEIEVIIYQNGERDVFDSKINGNANTSNISDDELFSALTKKHNKVYIDSNNENAIIHASDALRGWGYWEITWDKDEADFILMVNIRFGFMGKAFGSARFINPQNGETFKSTKELSARASGGLNTKRAVINKIVNKEIKTLYQSK